MSRGRLTRHAQDRGARRAVEVELDRPRRLIYDMNAFAELQAAGIQAGVVGQTGIIDSANFLVVRMLAWAGLLHDHPRLTLREAGDLLEDVLDAEGTLDPVVEAINEALDRSGYVDGDDEDDDDEDGAESEAAQDEDPSPSQSEATG